MLLSFTSATNFDELRTVWNSSAPSKATLNALEGELGRAGASIVYISRDWRTVGIYGTLRSLATIYVYTISLSDAGSLASIMALAGGCQFS
jgi:hypothetical protein